MAKEPEMDLKTALDLAESYHTRQVKPFAKLAEVLKLAYDAETRAKAANQQTSAASAELQRVRDAIEAANRDLNEVQKRAKETTTALATQLKKAQDETTYRLKGLEADLAQAEREHAAERKRLAQERADVERVAAEGIAAAQSKLADAQKKHADFIKSIGAA